MPSFAESRRPRALALAFVLVLTLPSALPAAGAGAPMPALSRANLDTTCAPCRDFYRYANGGWLDHHTIPAANANWGSFTILAENNREFVRGILERAAADKTAKPESDTGKLGAYWCACMDSAAVDAAGSKPIEPLIREVAALRSVHDIAGTIAYLHDRSASPFFILRVMQDPKQSDLQIAFALPGGLGLPDRDYYTRTDSAAVETRARYQAHLQRYFALAGDEAERARAEAQRVVALETTLANAAMTAVERRDPNATYHKVSLDSLERLAPRFDWATYLSKRGIARLDSVNVTQPRFFMALDSLLGSVSLDDWKAYLRSDVMREAASQLARPWAEEEFQFSRVLSGVETMPPRWKRCLTWTDRDLGDLVGKAYVRERFPDAARQRALDLVKNLEAALDDRIAALDWMSPETRTRAAGKLRAFEENIGYPASWRDYSNVRPTRTTHFANAMGAAVAETHRNLGKLGQPVDRGEWNMTTPTVNAYYSASLNSINFPAGILQPPFFDPSWDDATNYGGIGTVIGHEMTHGFDDRGRLFDDRGNLRDWWTANDATSYKERARRVAEQFDGYTVLDTLHLNGRLTLGENIADLGGVAVAYAALQKALAKNPAPVIDGYTPAQRFFLAYARVWATQYRPASLRTLVQTNPHSPGMWRVNGPLSNLSEFSAAWGCQAGDAMVRPADRQARIW